MASIVTVGDHATDQREEKEWELSEKRIESEEERRTRQRENEPLLSESLHPRADGRRKRREPEIAKVRMRERRGKSLNDPAPWSRSRSRCRGRWSERTDGVGWGLSWGLGHGMGRYPIDPDKYLRYDRRTKSE